MKYLISIILIASITSIIYGFTIQETDVVFAHKCIGFGTVGIFLIAMPLFLITVSKGKNMKDYMLNEENIRRMQGKDSRSKKKE
ncbi:hypothetical protein [Arenibacter certesii]|uniref:Uncharacterized protein n=1 Tax=Arenibacter certesii TaxID=228955 RepID=A0A918MMY4_9FLAO|nr:hypothetical protein [Arenibacter certesii]GGW37764.1 hypothetical protein GCM10007383_23210 [Arenibacter certesii]